jgi:hypothetical protein
MLKAISKMCLTVLRERKFLQKNMIFFLEIRSNLKAPISYQVSCSVFELSIESETLTKSQRIANPISGKKRKIDQFFFVFPTCLHLNKQNLLPSLFAKRI